MLFPLWAQCGERKVWLRLHSGMSLPSSQRSGVPNSRQYHTEDSWLELTHDMPNSHEFSQGWARTDVFCGFEVDIQSREKK